MQQALDDKGGPVGGHDKIQLGATVALFRSCRAGVHRNLVCVHAMGTRKQAPLALAFDAAVLAAPCLVVSPKAAHCRQALPQPQPAARAGSTGRGMRGAGSHGGAQPLQAQPQHAGRSCAAAQAQPGPGCRRGQELPQAEVLLTKMRGLWWLRRYWDTCMAPSRMGQCQQQGP